MPAGVFHIRGPFTFDEGLPISAQFVRDAKVLLALSAAEFESLCQSLATFAGFFDRQTLREFVAKSIPDSQHCNSISQIVSFVYQRQSALEESLREWHSSKENEGDKLLSASELDSVLARLRQVLKSIPGLDRQAKAERLSVATGNRLEGFELICDLRPVFDATRQRIEAFIPYTILKVTAEGAEGLPVSFESILAEEQVQSLRDAAESALKKLAGLRQFVATTQLPIPSVKLTKQGAEDA
jgi:hypothetical protein